MDIGMFTSGYQYYPLEYAFRDAKKIGYDYIELWGGRPHAFPYDLAAGDIHLIQQLIERYGIPVKVFTPEHNAYPFNYMIGSESQRKEAISYLKCAIDMGKAMGAQYTLISTGHAGYTASRKEIWERLTKSLRELSDHAGQIGHTIVLESLTGYETNVCTSANDVAEILDMINSPALLGMCDIVAPAIQQEPAINYMEKLGQRCAHLHIIDSDGNSETHVLPGDGCLPMRELLHQFQDYGYDGMATIELVTAYMREPYLYAKIAHDRIRDMLK